MRFAPLRRVSSSAPPGSNPNQYGFVRGTGEERRGDEKEHTSATVSANISVSRLRSRRPRMAV